MHACIWCRTARRIDRRDYCMHVWWSWSVRDIEPSFVRRSAMPACVVVVVVTDVSLSPIRSMPPSIALRSGNSQRKLQLATSQNNSHQHAHTLSSNQHNEIVVDPARASRHHTRTYGDALHLQIIDPSPSLPIPSPLHHHSYSQEGLTSMQYAVEAHFPVRRDHHYIYIYWSIWLCKIDLLF